MQIIIFTIILIFHNYHITLCNAIVHAKFM